MLRTAAVIVMIGAMLAAGPALAQFGNFFGDQPPPRPPADVPNGFPSQPPPVQYPGQSAPPPYAPAAPPPSGIEAEPLPPPAGASLAPPPAATPTAPAPGRAAPAPVATENQHPAPPPANPPPLPPAETSPQPDDTVVTETPTQHIENGRAVFAGLDKITGRTISFDAAIGETVQFGALQVTARACYTRPPTEATNTDAFVEVDEVTLKGEIKRIFTGWMFASSPGLNAVEHPIYDVWLTNCESPLPNQTAETSQPAPLAAGTPVPARPRQSPRQQPAPANPAQPR